VYAYGKLYEAKAVPSASDRLRMLQRKLVAHHAMEWDAQGVSNVAWSLSKQGLLIGEAAVALQMASRNTAASMDAQAVANTLWAFANMNLELGGAQEPLMHAVVRVSDSMNALGVANTL
jgi:hypothetical protein